MREKERERAGKHTPELTRQWTPAAFLVLGLLSFGMLVATYRSSEGLRMNFAVTGAIETVMIRTATSHLSLHQWLAGDMSVDVKNIWADLDDAIRLVTVILNGGESEHGMLLTPLKGRDLKLRLTELKALLVEFKTLAQERYGEPKGSAAQTLDQRIDASFKVIQDKILSLEMVFEKKQIREQSRSKVLHSGILLVCAFIVVFGTALLRSREMRRREVEEEIKNVARFPAENPNPVLRIRGDGRILYANEASNALLRDWGKASGDLVPETWAVMVTEVLGTGARKATQAELDGRTLSFTVVPSPSAGYVNIYGQDVTQRQQAETELKKHQEHLEELIKDRTEELSATVGLLQREVAERTRAEETLRESERRFRELSRQFYTLLEAISDPLTLLSPDLKVLWGNRSALAISGRGATDLAGHSCYSLWHDRSTPCEECPVVKSFRTGKGESARMERRRGRSWELRAFPVVDEGGNVKNVLTVASDITEKLSLETEARRMAHLASLGELAAGVAHEINNPINGIINYAQILANKTQERSRENEIALSIIREGDRIAGIVKSLLSFARAGRTEKNPASVREILMESLALTSTQMRKDGITVEVDVPAGLPKITAHPQQIQQVFMNIITNARYALNQKYEGVHKDKILKIACERATVDNQPHVRISFYDQGTGIPGDTINKVVNPFFSTKPRGKGTGLGLSISHGIITDHGGRLSIESIEGEFTRVLIELPAKEE